jgi:ubiquinone/menaquinone biosynthesis C-methylase UbiE
MSRREIWDKIYQKFDGFNELDNVFYARLIETITRYIKDEQNILEVGSGSGYLVSYFQNKNLFSVGLDRSVVPVKVAKKKFGVKNMILGDMFNLPFRDNSFDIVWNEGVIEHFADPKNIQACKEMARVSRKYVIVAVPNKNPVWLIRKTILKITNKWPYGYEESYSISRLKNLFHAVGLKVEEIVGIRILPPIKEVKKAKDLLALATLTFPISSKNIKMLAKNSLSLESRHKTCAKIFGYAIMGIGKK